MARLPTTGEYRTGPHGGYGYKRTEGHGRCHAGYPCWHWGLDMYPADLDEWIVAPEDATIAAVRTDVASPGPLEGYGPGGLRLVSRGHMVDLFSGLKVWHTLAHLNPADVAKGWRVGQEVAEGTPLARVFVPATRNDGSWRHLHYEIWRRASVPRGQERGAHTYNPATWASRRRVIDAAAATGMMAAALGAAGQLARAVS